MDKTKYSRIGKMRLFFILMICLFLVSCGPKNDNNVGTAKKNPNVTAIRAEVASIDGVVNAIYESISFGESEKPDMMRFRSLCSPTAPFIRIRHDSVDKMNIESFISSFQERVDTGILKSFYEKEIFRKTHRYGSIAQVFSTYEKGMNTDDPDSSVRGINSIQLYYDGERWWISCLIWEDERPDNPIPEEFLR